MPYTRPEQLGNQGQRRVIGILTFSNIAGGIVGAGCVWLLSGFVIADAGLSVLGMVRYILCALGMAIGVFTTFRFEGISRLDTAILWVNFRIRKTGKNATIEPQLQARSTDTTAVSTVIRDGVFIADLYDPEAEALQAQVTPAPVPVMDLHTVREEVTP